MKIELIEFIITLISSMIELVLAMVSIAQQYFQRVWQGHSSTNPAEWDVLINKFKIDTFTVPSPLLN